MTTAQSDRQTAAAGGLGRALTWSASGDIASKLTVIVINVIAARLLAPERFAAYVGLLAAAYVGAAAWDAGVSTLVSVERSKARAPLGALVRRVAWVRLLTFPAWLIAFALGSMAVANATGATLPEVLPFALVSLLVSIQQPIISAIRADLHFRDASLSQFAGRSVTAATLAAAVALGIAGGGLVTIGVAFVAGEVIALAAASVVLFRAASGSGDLAWDTSSIRLRRSLPYAANSMINISLHRLDVVIVALLVPAAQMAAYAPASRIQDALYVLPAAVAAVALPHLARQRAGPDPDHSMLETVRRLWLIGLLVTIPALVVLVALMPDAIRLALGPEYVASASPARIIVWSIPAAVIGGPLLAFLVATGRGTQTTLAFATALAVSLSLHILLDPRFGAEGAAVATVGRDVAIAAVAALLAGRVMLSGTATARPRDAEIAIETREETVP